MNNNEDVFLKQMKGVSPIKKNNRIKKGELETKNIFLKKNKTNETKQTNNKPSSPRKKIKNSEFSLEKIDLKKGIKKGLFNIDKKIDFHGKTLIESEEKFTSTILDCYNSDQRFLLFITGKGLFKSKNPENKDNPKLYHSVIRSSLVMWAKSNKFSKYILSFEQASIKHGGEGAFYVYLRKKKN